jgi:predicted DNA binding CopG/RHH family protein
MKILKTIPEFKSEREERKFWMTHDSTEYVDWAHARRGIFPNLKPTCKSISLRLPVSMVDQMRVLANKRDVPYQSLLKTFLADRLKKEFV